MMKTPKKLQGLISKCIPFRYPGSLELSLSAAKVAGLVSVVVMCGCGHMTTGDKGERLVLRNSTTGSVMSLRIKMPRPGVRLQEDPTMTEPQESSYRVQARDGSTISGNGKVYPGVKRWFALFIDSKKHLVRGTIELSHNLPSIFTLDGYQGNDAIKYYIGKWYLVNSDGGLRVP